MTSVVSSSANTQPSAPQLELRVSSGHVVRKPALLKDCLICAFGILTVIGIYTDTYVKCTTPLELYISKFLYRLSFKNSRGRCREKKKSNKVNCTAHV